MTSVDLVEAAILVFLFGGIGYGYVLSRRLERLSRALVEFGPALAAFSAAVDRTERSVTNLRDESLRIETAFPNVNRPVPAPESARRPATSEEREVLINSLMEIVRGRRRGC